MAIRAFKGREPAIEASAFVEESAQVIGDVTIGARSSIWFNTVVRGDVNSIRIGEETNVQDLCCLHVTHEKYPLSIGSRVTVGHSVTLHGCTVGDDCLIGMGAILLDGVEVGPGCLVAAGALLPPSTKVPAGTLVMGSPANIKRKIGEDERAFMAASAAHYVGYAREYRSC